MRQGLLEEQCTHMITMEMSNKNFCHPPWLENTLLELDLSPFSTIHQPNIPI